MIDWLDKCFNMAPHAYMALLAVGSLNLLSSLLEGFDTWLEPRKAWYWRVAKGGVNTARWAVDFVIAKRRPK